MCPEIKIVEECRLGQIQIQIHEHSHAALASIFFQKNNEIDMILLIEMFVPYVSAHSTACISGSDDLSRAFMQSTINSYISPLVKMHT